MSTAKTYYYQHAGPLNRELKQALPGSTLKALHRKQPARHFLIAGRQILLLAGLPVLIYHFQQPWIWVPAAIWLGFVVFSFSVLLHEAIHKTIFNQDPGNWSFWLGQLYGTLSGLSYSQFRRWHLDHHAELGSATADPKRAHLSPKINAPWYKLLYCTPALYPIYFRAAAKAQAGYAPELQRRIARERVVSIGFHLSILALFFYLDPLFGLKGYVLPVFFVFPIAFTLNRLGQHYLIDPSAVAKWSTLMKSNPVWDLLFLFSTYHIEHHYFPAVPFYHLKRLNRELTPFFEKHHFQAFTYRQLLKAWFWDNHVPHTAPEPHGNRGTRVDAQA